MGLEHLEKIPKWDQYFLGFIDQVRSRSKDPNTQVGCVIVNEFNNIIMTGYNSLPAGLNDYVPERYERPEKYFWMAHSEENAICAAAKAGIALHGSRIFLNGVPCSTCARMVIGSGIKEIVYNATEWVKWDSPKYDKTDEKRSRQMFFEAHITIRGVEV